MPKLHAQKSLDALLILRHSHSVITTKDVTDEDALIEAIAANPEDDTPRLVYADWLGENGQSDRATFIRNQIGLARGLRFDPASGAVVALTH